MPGEREGYPGIRAATGMRDKEGTGDTGVGSNHNITPTRPPAPYNHLMGPHTPPPDAGTGPYTPYLPRILHTRCTLLPVYTLTNPSCTPLGLHDDPVVKTRRMRCVRGDRAGSNHHIPPTHSPGRPISSLVHIATTQLKHILQQGFQFLNLDTEIMFCNQRGLQGWKSV